MESRPEGRTEPPGPSSAEKPDLTKRFVARFVDGVVAAVASAVLALLLPGFLGDLVGALAAAAYILLSDGLDVEYMHHRSLGKHLLGLRPHRLQGGAMNPETSARRNWPFAVGYLSTLFGWALSLVSLGLVLYEIYNVVTDPQGRRWGDRLAGTYVANAGAAPSGPPPPTETEHL